MLQSFAIGRPKQLAFVLVTLGMAGPLVGSAFAGDMVDDDRGPVKLKTDLGRAERDRVHDLTAETRDRVAEILERLDVRRKSKGATRMRVYATRDGFEQRKRKTTPVDMHWASAFFDPSNNEVVLWWAGGGASGRETLRHEVTHQIVAEVVKNAPIWFNEGLASYVGAMELDRYGDPIVLVSEKKLKRMRWAFKQNKHAPLYDLMDMQWLEFYGKQGTKKLQWDRTTMYAQSWSLVFFLLHATSEEDKEFAEKVAERIDTGRWKQTAFKKTLGKLEPRWRSFVDREDLIKADKASRAAHKAWSANDAARAIEKAKETLAIDPDRRSVARILGEASVASGAPAEAIPVFRELLKQGESESLCMGMARALIAVSKSINDSELAKEARAAAMRASELAPNQRAYDALALAADACELMGDTKGALHCVREALKEKALPAAKRKPLRDRERLLVKRSIKGE